MNTKKIKSFFIISILSFLMVCPLFAQIEDLHFSVGMSGGYKFGSISELLYFKNTDVLNSRLDWDVYTPSLDLDLGVNYKNFFLQTKFDVPLPCKCGTMSDYDWLNYENYGTTELSRYSTHENYIDYGFSFNGKLGYDFKINNIVTLSPLFSYEIDLLKFTAKNGYKQYPSKDAEGKEIWTEDTSKVDLNGNIISYQQNIYLYGLGLNTRITPVNRLSLDFLAQANLMNYVSFDYHILRSKVFADQILIGFAFDFMTKATLNIYNNHNITIGYKAEIVPTQRGNTYSQVATGWQKWTTDGWFRSSNKEGGLSRFISTVSVGYEFIF